MSQAKFGSMVLADGGQYSSVLNLHRQARDAYHIGLLGINAQEVSKTFNIQVTDNPEPDANSNFFDLKDTAGNNIAPPIEGAARTYDSLLPYSGVRIKANAAVTTGSTWRATKSTATVLNVL